jgi:hypothetical protein
VAGVRALKQKQYGVAQQNVNQSIRGPITDLVATLVAGWASYGAGHTQTAISNIDKLTGPEWYPIFKDLHTGMIYELANKQKEAGPVRTRLQARRFGVAGFRCLCALALAQQGRSGCDGGLCRLRQEARASSAGGGRHPRNKAGKKLPPLAENPQQGAAEALYGIGASLTRAAAKTLRWSICSSRSTSIRTIRWRCSPSPTFMSP